MSDRPQPLHIRIFLSSPGDVADERSVALQVIDRIEYDPLLRGRITVEVVAWDKPGADTPMLATMTPQEAINLGLPTPAVCDIVAVIFWARMGTPLPADYTRPDGSRYLSGTAWEYENAMQASKETGRPLVVVYRRLQDVSFNPRDAQFAQKLEQWERVEAFFAGFINPDGSIRQGYNQYQTPDDFREKFETHLKSLIKRLLDEAPPDAVEAKRDIARLWEGSPFPGLRAYTPADAPIFFGRGAETDALVRRLSDPACRLVAVVGASGSGKSSLVGAGLIPRLAANAIEGSRDWVMARFTPGELASGDPFEALAVALVRDLPALRITPARDLTHRLQEQVEALREIAQDGLADRPAWAELVLFIDQFEELFSLVRLPHVAPFIDRLADAARAPRLRVVITLRADFYAKCVEYPTLADLLETTTYPLAAPEMGALYEMVARPADLAGLTFEDGLVNRILDDTGTEPGALALMAYALDELYRA